MLMDLGLDLLKHYENFVEIQNCYPRSKLTTEDLWECANFVLSVKLMETQFSGQLKRIIFQGMCNIVSLVLKR